MPNKKTDAITEYQDYYDGMTKEEKINFALGIFACSVILVNFYRQLTKKNVK